MATAVSVLTPTIPSRAEMLEECQASVEAQTFTDYEHLVFTDVERRGCSWTMNLLAEKAHGDWLLPLADDDLLLPGGLRALYEYTDAGDIIYAPPLMYGWDSWHFFQDPPLIPSCALIRRDLWHELGGYESGIIREEDRGLWERAVEVDATFVKVNYPVWVYRFHGGNKSLRAGLAA